MARPAQPQPFRKRFPTLAGFALAACLFTGAHTGLTAGSPGLKSENFDKDPGWEGFNNRIKPEKSALITQDFGYSATGFAAKSPGEIGGLIARASVPAWYADKIAPRTLDEPLTATGTFALTRTGGGGGLFFGWFNSHQTEGTGRALAALGLDIGTEKIGAGLHVRLHTSENQSCGMAITPKHDGTSRAPLRNDGTRYSWSLNYDPAANDGKGRVTFTIRANTPSPEPFERQTFTLDLPDGYRKQGTTFDRFGLMNKTKPGGHASIFFADLEYDGHSPDLTQDPHWDAVANRATYAARESSGANDFGFTDSDHAGGKAGGLIWRTGKRWGCYADRIGPLSLDAPLQASGKVCLTVGAPDSGMCFGWFLGENKQTGPDRAGNFLGVKIAGPSRAGHYFQPACTTAAGVQRVAGQSPLLVPGRTYEWSLDYDPSGNHGLGVIRVTLGRDAAVFNLKAGDKKAGARFDHFGLFSLNNDGGHGQVKIYWDDLKYTAVPPAR